MKSNLQKHLYMKLSHLCMWLPRLNISGLLLFVFCLCFLLLDYDQCLNLFVLLRFTPFYLFISCCLGSKFLFLSITGWCGYRNKICCHQIKLLNFFNNSMLWSTIYKQRTFWILFFVRSKFDYIIWDV